MLHEAECQLARDANVRAEVATAPMNSVISMIEKVHCSKSDIPPPNYSKE